jgi:hypothetical protein
MEVNLIGQFWNIPFNISGTINSDWWIPWLSPSAIFIAAIASAVIAAWTWNKNEESKRIFEEYKRREKMYSGLINSLRGFYIKPETNTANFDEIEEFIKQLNLCWMYCPDDVITSAYSFIDSVHTEQGTTTDKAKEEAYGKVILSIRKDLIDRKIMKKTNFKPNDFRHIKPNRSQSGRG